MNVEYDNIEQKIKKMTREIEEYDRVEKEILKTAKENTDFERDIEELNNISKKIEKWVKFYREFYNNILIFFLLV